MKRSPKRTGFRLLVLKDDLAYEFCGFGVVCEALEALQALICVLELNGPKYEGSGECTESRVGCTKLQKVGLRVDLSQNCTKQFGRKRRHHGGCKQRWNTCNHAMGHRWSSPQIMPLSLGRLSFRIIIRGLTATSQNQRVFSMYSSAVGLGWSGVSVLGLTKLTAPLSPLENTLSPRRT
jgi:hypothetical protein